MRHEEYMKQAMKQAMEQSDVLERAGKEAYGNVDMVNSPTSTFLKVLTYLSKIIKIDVDHTKMDKAIEETSFKNLKNLEINEGFKTNPSKNEFFRFY